MSSFEYMVIFRTGDAWQDVLYEELRKGMVRQGWGTANLALLDKDGNRIPKDQWTQNYLKDFNEEPTPRRHSALTPMLELVTNDLIVLPKMPNNQKMSIARVNGCYRFERTSEHLKHDFGHIIPVDPSSVRTFNYHDNDDAYTVSRLFARSNHRYPVTFAYERNAIEAAVRLLEEPQDIHTAKRSQDLVQAALDKARRKAAEAMLDHVATSWNGDTFEKLVKQAFKNQGYEVLHYARYRGDGGDVDMVVRLPSSRYSLFMPQEIAVQVKWKKGQDEDDAHAVEQLLKWRESDIAEKVVVSSARSFTQRCRELARKNDITLIGGLNTMYFLMGLPFHDVNE